MRSLFLIPLAALIVAAPADAKGKGGTWMEGPAVGLPKGSQLMVVKGDPSKAGDFTVHLKFPADFLVPAHSHPGDETVRVITGGPLHYGMGDKAGVGTPGTLEKGYHVTLGANMNHWAHAPVETVVQVDGKGPFAIKYANPADDPRTAK